MEITKKDLQSKLVTKFHFQTVDGSRHEALALFVDGRKVATCRFSRSHRSLSRQVLTLIARELWVQSGYLTRMYSCTIGRCDYLQHLQETGKLE